MTVKGIWAAANSIATDVRWAWSEARDSLCGATERAREAAYRTTAAYRLEQALFATWLATRHTTPLTYSVSPSTSPSPSPSPNDGDAPLGS